MILVSFNEILEDMKSTYFEQSGQVLDMYSETGLRLKAVATELFNLYVKGEYLLGQSSWQTATGDYLDRIATECSIQRKTASRATGTLTFYIDAPREAEVSIPSGIICSKKGYKYIQYITLEPAVIGIGEVSCTVEAQSIGCGQEYNAGYGEISVMVNPPSSIAGVQNKVSFTGGCSDEDDEALRSRIESALKYPANGVNVEFLIGRIMALDEVIGCRIVRENESVVCLLKTRDNTISDNLRDKVLDILSLFTLFDINVEVRIDDAGDI